MRFAVVASALNFIFPARCVHCRDYVRYDAALCNICARRMVMHNAVFCGQCHARRSLNSSKRFRLLCHADFPYLLAAAGEYSDPILQGLIRALKFHFIRAAAAPLADFLMRYTLRVGIVVDADMIVPIPLSRRRLKERGFNQAELIGKMFAARVGLPLDTKALIRARHTQPQSSLPHNHLRAVNTAGCFQIREGARIKDSRILLLDDVVTTGATAKEAARVLLNAGAKSVITLAAAKAS